MPNCLLSHFMHAWVLSARGCLYGSWHRACDDDKTDLNIKAGPGFKPSGFAGDTAGRTKS